MSDKINAWIHWVKLNPINEDQLLFAIEVEKLKKENEVLRSALEFYANEAFVLKVVIGGLGDYEAWQNDKGLIARKALEQVDKIRGE
jgi:hypothetical protein